jgi:hypothetical protein
VEQLVLWRLPVLVLVVLLILLVGLGLVLVGFQFFGVRIARQMFQVAEVSPKSTAAGVRHFAQDKRRARSLKTASSITSSSSRFQFFGVLASKASVSSYGGVAQVDSGRSVSLRGM